MTAMPSPVRLLCVEDNPDDFELLELALAQAAPGRAYALTRVEDAEGMRRALAEPVDAVLCDYHLPRFSPQAALQLLRDEGQPLPMIVVTRAIGEQAAVGVLRLGARDYVTKDRLGTLPQVLDRVLQEQARVREERRLVRELQAAHRRLQTLSSRLVATQERERNLISHELHDQLGQQLAAMMLHLHAARAATDPQQASTHSDTALSLAQQAVEQLKSLSFALRPPQLDLLGLPATVETAVGRLADPAGLEWSVSTRGHPPQEAGDKAALALRLVQEAVANTVRHANASRVVVRLRFLPGGRIALLVADDGEGYDGRGLPPAQDASGLQDQLDRAELCAGQVRMRGWPGRGAIVRAIL